MRESVSDAGAAPCAPAATATAAPGAGAALPVPPRAVAAAEGSVNEDPPSSSAGAELPGSSGCGGTSTAPPASRACPDDVLAIATPPTSYRMRAPSPGAAAPNRSQPGGAAPFPLTRSSRASVTHVLVGWGALWGRYPPIFGPR